MRNYRFADSQLPRTVFVLLTIALTHITFAAPRPTTAPTTQPAAPALRMSDGVPLSKLENDATDIYWTYESVQQDATLRFGTLHHYDKDGELDSCSALIATKTGKTWKVISFAGQKLSDNEWLFAAAGPVASEVWAVLSEPISADDSQIVLVHSTDSGATWSLQTLAKPGNVGDYFDFRMLDSGIGSLCIYVAPDSGTDQKSGYYYYRTKDGGKTWGKIEFEPDHMLPAVNIEENEDDEAEEPIKPPLDGRL